MDDEGGVHEEHPFQEPMSERDPVRRFRGRMAAPVTIVTSGSEDDRAGLTIASVMVAEGDPGLVYFLVGSTTDLYFALQKTGKCVVHIGSQRHRGASDVFAGRGVEQAGHGPVLTDFDNLLRATVVSMEESSFSVLVAAAIDSVTLADTGDPLVWYRGSYRSLDL